jgi:hypothetical protein
MITDFIVVRHSRDENPRIVSIEKKDYDLTNYIFLRMSPTNPEMAEWVWHKDFDLYKSVLK